MHRCSSALRRVCSYTAKRNATSSASSLGQAVRTARTVESLDLQQSPDLLCVNLMCEKVGDPCICRLSGVLERLPQLKHLNLSHNQLTSIPESIGRLSQLVSLDLSNNKLTELPSSLRGLTQLQVQVQTLIQVSFEQQANKLISFCCTEAGPQGEQRHYPQYRVSSRGVS